MILNLTRPEIETIREACRHMIDCESDSAKQFPEQAEMFKQEVRNWQSLRRKIKTVFKAKRFAPTTRRK